jgi:SAM-dependent methyltransferase
MSSEKPPVGPIRKGETVSPGWDDSPAITLLVMGLETAMSKIGTPLTPKHTIVDVGTGNGLFCKILRDKGYTALGVDIEQRGTPGADVIARSEMLPFADASIDVVTSTQAFDANVYNQDQGAMLREIARILKPEGIFYTTADSFIVPIPPALRPVHGTKNMYRKST